MGDKLQNTGPTYLNNKSYFCVYRQRLPSGTFLCYACSANLGKPQKFPNCLARHLIKIGINKNEGNFFSLITENTMNKV